jgi:putative lysine/arginine/ornithine/histidine/octopine transport system permease protein
LIINLYGFGNTLMVGTWMTIKVTFVALLIGLLLGLLGAGAKLSRFSLLRYGADTYTTVIRGVPELILILAVYFGSSVVVNNIAGSFGYDGYINLNAFVAGVIALGLSFGAYATDVFRGAILAVPKGQIEAARSFGMSGILVFRRIMLPQVWRFALPALGNLFLILQKESALVSVIGLHEIMRSATVAVGYTKKPFTFYMAAAIIYLCLTIVTATGIHHMEKHVSRGVRRS